MNELYHILHPFGVSIYINVPNSVFLVGLGLGFWSDDYYTKYVYLNSTTPYIHLGQKLAVKR